jgi:hypothetical protein
MYIISEYLICVAQSDTYGNIQDTATELATSYMWAVLAIRQIKKSNLQNVVISFSSKKWVHTINCC